MSAYVVLCASGAAHLHEIDHTPCLAVNECAALDAAAFMDEPRPESLWDCGPHSVAPSGDSATSS